MRAPPSGRAEDISFLFSIFAGVTVYVYTIPPSLHQVHLTIIIITTIVVVSVGVVYVYIICTSVCVCVCTTIIQARTTNGSRYLNDGGHNIRITYILYKYSEHSYPALILCFNIYILYPTSLSKLSCTLRPGRTQDPHRVCAYLCDVCITQAQSTQYIIYFALL